MVTAHLQVDFEKFWGINGTVFMIPYSSPKDLYLDRSLSDMIRKIHLTLTSRAPLVILSGPNGIGKSTLAAYLYQTISTEKWEAILLDANYLKPAASITDLAGYRLITAKDVEAPFARAIQELITENRQLLLVIDHACALKESQVAEIDKLMQTFRGQLTILLITKEPGRINQLLSESSGSNIHTSFKLPPFDIDRTRGLIQFFITKAQMPQNPFSTEAIASIALESHGLPAQICQLCEAALVEAYLSRRTTICTTEIQTLIKRLPDLHHFEPQNVKDTPSAASIEDDELSEPIVSQHSSKTDLLEDGSDQGNVPDSDTPEMKVQTKIEKGESLISLESLFLNPEDPRKPG